MDDASCYFQTFVVTDDFFFIPDNGGTTRRILSAEQENCGWIWTEISGAIACGSETKRLNFEHFLH